MKAKRQEIQNENPDITFEGISKVLSDKWKVLSPYERRKYELLSEEDKRLKKLATAEYEKYISLQKSTEDEDLSNNITKVKEIGKSNKI